MRSDLIFYSSLVIIAMVGMAVLLPGNPVTGTAVLDTESCGKLGCMQLCDDTSECESGMVCCLTTWEDGLCDYAENCPVLAEYAAKGGSLEEYQMLREESPQAIRNIGFKTFWLPMLVVAAICIGIVWRAKNKPV